MASQSDSPSISLLPTGSNIQILDGSFVQYNNVTAPKALKPLYERVSPNAILNAGGRADAVRCYPGTREEVISKIEKWRKANHSQGHPIFWLSGPAGAGKSAIVQTIAERCIEQKVPMVNFFFFRADNTRNHSESIVATLLFQLFDLFPSLKAHIMDIVANNPVIFRQSMAHQFSTLIENPLRTIQQSSGEGPILILIDGLDECSSEHGKAEQASLLHIFYNIATKVDPPFVVLVASRTESHITMTFNHIGPSPDSIYLDDSYRPFDDIRLFLTGEFSRIKQTHTLRGTLDANWPLHADVDSIAHKSSGQFVYAATVARFIATSPASPKRSLEIVLGLRPVTKISPFATLDSLYTHILSQADDWKSVHDILAAHKVASDFPISVATVLSFFGYSEDDILSASSDLTSIIQYKAGELFLTIFHASLLDFLYDSSRAGPLYIDVNAFACRLAPLSFEGCDEIWMLSFCFSYLLNVTMPDETLDKFLMSYIPDTAVLLVRNSDSTRQKNECMQALKKMYQSKDPQIYENIRNHWQNLLFPVESTTAEASTNSQSMSRPSQTQLVQRSSTSSFRWFPKFRWRKNRNT